MRSPLKTLNQQGALVEELAVLLEEAVAMRIILVAKLAGLGAKTHPQPAPVSVQMAGGIGLVDTEGMERLGGGRFGQRPRGQHGAREFVAKIFGK